MINALTNMQTSNSVREHMLLYYIFWKGVTWDTSVESPAITNKFYQAGYGMHRDNEAYVVLKLFVA